MPNCFSKPHIPLGSYYCPEKKRLELFEPRPIQECPICLEPLPWNRFIDLPCSHAFCTACLLWNFKVLLEDRDYNPKTPLLCPMCRFDVKVTAFVDPAIHYFRFSNLHVQPKFLLLIAIHDIFDNFHPIGFKFSGSNYSGIGFLGSSWVKCKKKPRSMITFNTKYSDPFTILSPYKGVTFLFHTIRPRLNPIFQIVNL